jgi:phosphatidylglycerol lysyltransferase
MDALNNFDTPNTRCMVRLEYGFLLLVSIAVTLYNWQDVRLIPLIILFAYIDLIGYLPGAIAYRKYNGKVPEFYYVLYNFTHNFVTAAAVAFAWCYFVKVEWALMGILIHLFGDRSLFGNEFKSRAFSFEPVKHQLFQKFETQFLQQRKLSLPASNINKKLLLAEKYGEHPSLFLVFNREISSFTVPNTTGYIPFRDDGKCLFILTGVISADAEKEVLLTHFIQYAQKHKREICGVQIRKEQVSLFEKSGFQVNQMGCSYSLDLERFSLSGTAFMSLRNKLSRAKIAGVSVHELGVDFPKGEKQVQRMAEITAEWLNEKGNKLLSFMVGELNASELDKERIFVAVKDGEIIGFISYVPSFGKYQGWMHDLTRRAKEVPPGTMELINVEAINRFKREGEKYLNFGFTPFFGVCSETDHYASRSLLLSRIIYFLEHYGQMIYPALSQVAYKRKWRPMEQSPEYFAAYKKFRVTHLLRLMKLTNAL